MGRSGQAKGDAVGQWNTRVETSSRGKTKTPRPSWGSDWRPPGPRWPSAGTERRTPALPRSGRRERERGRAGRRALWGAPGLRAPGWRSTAASRGSGGRTLNGRAVGATSGPDLDPGAADAPSLLPEARRGERGRSSRARGVACATRAWEVAARPPGGSV